MAIFTTANLLYASLIASAVGTAVSTVQAGKQAEAEEEAREKQQAQQEAERLRERRKAVRESRIRRAQIAQSGASGGVSGSSGVTSAIGTVDQDIASFSAAQLESSRFSSAISGDLQDAADAGLNRSITEGVTSIFSNAFMAGAKVSSTKESGTLFGD